MKLYDENTGQQFNKMFSDFSETIQEMNSVRLITLAFFIPLLITTWFTSGAKDRADLLGGKETVESFLTANIISLTVCVLTGIAFIFYVSKTWKGKATPISSIMIYLAVLISVTIFTCVRIGAIANIREELKNPKTTKLTNFILCENASKDKYIAFDDEAGHVILQIPDDKYFDLQDDVDGRVSDVSLLHTLVEDAGYDDIEVKSGDVTVKYYYHSVIYESIK